MIEIIPAVLPTTYRAIEAKAALVQGIVKTMQVDLVDGIFAQNKTWPYNGKNEAEYQALLQEDAGLPYWEKINYEIDAMVADPITEFKTFITLGPSRIVFHLESLRIESWLEFFTRMDPYFKDTIEMGMAINTTTVPETLSPLLEHIRFVQCMGIEHVGFQGQPYDGRVIEQIKKVRSLTAVLPIAVDGAVTMENAAEMVRAGATRLVIGSALFGSMDIRGTIEAFQTLCQSSETIL